MLTSITKMLEALKPDPNVEMVKALVEKVVTNSQLRYKILQKSNSTLADKLATNKVFLYMVIHDLKHPTESVRLQLGHLCRMMADVVADLDPLNPPDTLES